ncbi:hypothetical protein BDR06DRAFT_1049683 [Suillus hirtellus]|nr:hypothetical protein BDR06DRAFT_1049683 [Suillus hirtellus]
MPHPIISEFDIIFAGGGSTACVVAGCLAALDPSLTILILEGGQHTLDQAAHVQPYKFITHLVPTSTTMTFNVGNPSPRLNSRAPSGANEFWMRRYIGANGRCSDAAHHYVYNQAHSVNLQIWAGKHMKRVIFQDKRAVGVEFASDPVSCPDAGQSSSIMKASKLVVISAGTFGSLAILERSGIGAEAILKQCNIEQLVDLPGVGENYQGLRDHNLVFTSYFAAEGTVTMDPLYLGEENDIVQKNLAQWKIDGKSLVAQNGSDAKIKWHPDDDELKAMGSAFQPQWKEFFQDRPDKAVALFSLSAGSSRFSHNFPCREYITANYFTLYLVSAGSVHIKLGENGQEGVDFNAGFLDE